MNSTTEDDISFFVKDTLPFWADGISFLLLGLMYVVLPIPPTRRLWLRPGETLLWRVIVLSNLGWNISRFVMEGIHQKRGPRGFSQLGLIYAIVWTYTLEFGWKEDVELYRRTKQVVDVVKHIKMVRYNERSFRPPEGNNFGHDRKGERQLVVRKGISRALWPTLAARSVVRLQRKVLVVQKDIQTEEETVHFAYRLFPASRNSGYKYWRGTETYVKKMSRGNRTVWYVELEEEDMHHDILEPFFRATNDKNKSELYQAIYDVAYISCRQDPNHEALLAIEGRKVEHMARRADCVDDNLLGGVARRIASDACYYAYCGDGEFRTKEQVEELNDIVDTIAGSKARQCLLPPSMMSQGEGQSQWT